MLQQLPDHSPVEIAVFLPVPVNVFVEMVRGRVISRKAEIAPFFLPGNQVLIATHRRTRQRQKVIAVDFREKPFHVVPVLSINADMVVIGWHLLDESMIIKRMIYHDVVTGDVKGFPDILVVFIHQNRILGNGMEIKGNHHCIPTFNKTEKLSRALRLSLKIKHQDFVSHFYKGFRQLFAEVSLCLDTAFKKYNPFHFVLLRSSPPDLHSSPDNRWHPLPSCPVGKDFLHYNT